MPRRIATRDAVGLGLVVLALVLLAIQAWVGARGGYDRPHGGVAGLFELPGRLLGWGSVALLLVALPYLLVNAWGRPPRLRPLAILGAIVLALGIGALAGVAAPRPLAGGGLVGGRVARMLEESLGSMLATTILVGISLPGALLALAPLWMRPKDTGLEGISLAPREPLEEGASRARAWYPERKVGDDGTEIPMSFGGSDVGPIRYREPETFASPTSDVPATEGVAGKPPRAKTIRGVRFADEEPKADDDDALGSVRFHKGADSASLAPGVRYADDDSPPEADASPFADADAEDGADAPASPDADAVDSDLDRTFSEPETATAEPAAPAAVSEPAVEEPAIELRPIDEPATTMPAAAEAATADRAPAAKAKPKAPKAKAPPPKATAPSPSKRPAAPPRAEPPAPPPPPARAAAQRAAAPAPTPAKRADGGAAKKPVPPAKAAAPTPPAPKAVRPTPEKKPVEPQAKAKRPPAPERAPAERAPAPTTSKPPSEAAADRAARPAPAKAAKKTSGAPAPDAAPAPAPAGASAGAADPLYGAAVAAALERGSTSLVHLRRALNVGYARASSLVDALVADGVLGEMTASGSRPTLVTAEQWARRSSGGAKRRHGS